MHITSSTVITTRNQNTAVLTSAVWVIGHLPMCGLPDHPRGGAGFGANPAPRSWDHNVTPARAAHSRPLPPLYLPFPGKQVSYGTVARLLFVEYQSISGVSEDRPRCGPQLLAPVDGLLITADASFKRINWRKRALQSVVAAVSALQLNSPPTMAGRRSCLTARRR